MEDKKKSISIVLTGYNAGQHLSACLESIYKQTYKDFEIIFVDNGSRDNTSSILTLYPEVKIIHNDENKGFCAANNQAIKEAVGDYILSLNSDVVLDDDFLLEIKKAVNVNNAGLFAAKILSGNGKSIDSSGLILSDFYRFFDRGSGEPDKGQYDASFEVFGPCAAAALYKREMLEDICHDGEYFDERFFFLAEDFDIAWRARRKGWKTRFIPGAICYHARNSTNFNRKFRQFLSFRNRYFLLLKNGQFGLRYIIVFFFYDLPRLLYMLLSNKYTCKALYDMVRYTPEMLRKKYV